MSNYNGLTLNEYQELAARTINASLTPYQKIEHALFGMASEVGEIHGIYQKALQGHLLDPADVKEEAGDLMWFIAELCTAFGWRMSDIACGNVEKLLKRYPKGFDADRSVNRSNYEGGKND